jgi:aminoglycoside phosphotransferase (APT) family kinase protein
VSVRLHRDEVPVDRELVRRLLGAQHPTWAGLDLRLVDPPGTDNVVFRLGDELSVRLPRKQAAVPRLGARAALAAPDRAVAAAGRPGAGRRR